MVVPHDTVYEGLKKLPRAGRWNLRWKYVELRCPVCELVCHLGRHAIDAEGHVSPSVVCPHSREDGTACTFHEFVTLQGWRRSIQQLPF